MSAKLYDYWRSSAAYRLRITLNLLGLDYDREVVDLTTAAHKGPDNLARNPQGLVPTLEIDGQTFTQSLAIVEYLDETRHAGLLPDTPIARVRVRKIAYAIAMEIHAVCNLSVARFASENSAKTITMQGWMQRFITPGLNAVEIMLRDPLSGEYCHGDTVTMADICLMPQLYNAERWGIDTGAMANITRIASNLRQIPAFARAHPDNYARASG